jgi:hypothetical protein
MRRLGVLMSFMLLVLALVIGTSFSPSQAAAPIPVSVSSVVVKAGDGSNTPVCRGNNTGGYVGVSATVSATFDSSSTSTADGSCAKARCSGTSRPQNCSRRTDTTTIITVTPTLNVTASDGTNTASLSGTNGGTYTGNLPTGSEGSTDVTVTASASESVTTQENTVTYTWGSNDVPNTDCSGTGTQTGSTTGTPTTANKSGADTSPKVSYLVDLIGPTAEVNNYGLQTITQGQYEKASIKTFDASAGTQWTIVVKATAPDSTEYTGSDTDTYNSSPDGIVHTAPTHGPIGVEIPCGAPLGEYSLSVKVMTKDLCGQAYPDIILETDKNGDPMNFTVNSGLDLAAETGVLSQLTNGDYGIDECFVDSVKQTGKKLIVNNTPGSVHIYTLVTTAGACAGIGTISGVNLTLTLPEMDTSSGFTYETTGASPNAHIFVGDGSGGLDLHNGAPLIEVTNLVTQFMDGQNIYIDLSSLGEIPANQTIFARAHARFGATAKAGQPASDTPFMFSSSAGTAEGLSNSSVYYISGNPTQLMDNLTGDLGGGTESCDADGLFTP